MMKYVWWVVLVLQMINTAYGVLTQDYSMATFSLILMIVSKFYIDSYE